MREHAEANHDLLKNACTLEPHDRLLSPEISALWGQWSGRNTSDFDMRLMLLLETLRLMICGQVAAAFYSFADYW
jgi:hypothetical protein